MTAAIAVPKTLIFLMRIKSRLDGEQYNIVGIQKHYDDKKLHHLEVELCL